MDRKTQKLSDALRQMPVPPPRAGFVDDVLAKATATPQRTRAVRPVAALWRWETWMGAAIGAAAAVIATVMTMRPDVPAASTGITLAVNEARNIEVLIDSERALEAATIRVVTTGGVELDGLEDRHEVEWQTHLDRGRNVLSLPIVARTSGSAQLVAVIEHDGRTRRVAVNLSVKPPQREVA